MTDSAECLQTAVENLAAQRERRLVMHARVVSGTGGGPDKTILNSPRFLRDAGYPMVCAYMRNPSDRLFERLEERARRWQANLIPVDDFGPFDWRLVGRFVRLCKEHRPAIWHGHDYKSNLLGLLVRRHHPMRLVTTVHGWVKHTWKTPLYYAIDRYCLRRYDQVVCVSTDLHRSCLELGLPPERCWHVPNAIDVDEFKRTQSSREAKARLGIPEDRLLILAVGRLSDEKGFDLLIRAAGELIRRGANIELRIAGEGDRFESLQNEIARLGLQDRVQLLGFCADAKPLYQAADVFALSSIREGLPNVLLEAMAFGLPVVSTNVAGIPKLIGHEENGLLIEPGSVAALASAMESLVASAPLRDRLGQAARNTIEQSHSFAKRMETIKSIYDASFDD